MKYWCGVVQALSFLETDASTICSDTSFLLTEWPSASEVKIKVKVKTKVKRTEDQSPFESTGVDFRLVGLQAAVFTTLAVKVVLAFIS